MKVLLRVWFQLERCLSCCFGMLSSGCNTASAFLNSQQGCLSLGSPNENGPLTFHPGEEVRGRAHPPHTFQRTYEVNGCWEGETFFGGIASFKSLTLL